MVAVYDRETNDVREQQPINTAVIGHFYTMEDELGRKRFELEQSLSWNESKAISVIKKLSAKEDVTTEDRHDLALFIALATTRTPDFVDTVKAANSDLVGQFAKSMCADVNSVKARLRRMRNAPAGEVALDAEARMIVELVKGNEITFTTDHKWAVGMAMEVAMTIAPILAGRNWVVSHRENEKTSFITTDAPVCLTTVARRPISWAGVGFGNTDALVFFPLSQSCMVAMFGNNGDLQHTSVEAKKVRQANLGFADQCQRFVIGRDPDLVRSLSKHLGLAKKKWRPKMQLR